MDKFKWSDEDVKFIKEWWPHFGTAWVAKSLGYTALRVKTKADKLKLKMLDKPDRLCIECQSDYQYIDPNAGRRTNRTCKSCELLLRKQTRKSYPEYNSSYKKKQYEARRADKTWSELFNEIARTLRYRNKKLHNCSDMITAEVLQDMFERQKGKCYYSGRVMDKPITNDGIKNYNVLSVDRIDSYAGYSSDNIVLCTFGCNVGKGQMTHDEYIKLCEDVALAMST